MSNLKIEEFEYDNGIKLSLHYIKYHYEIMKETKLTFKYEDDEIQEQLEYIIIKEKLLTEQYTQWDRINYLFDYIDDNLKK